MNRKPDFFGLGALKTATTWIHACLHEHPGIFMPITKELEFFNYNYDRGFEWYNSHFRRAATDQVIGEFTSSYLHHSDVPQRLFDYQPTAKLLVCLRNPVNRLLSQYHYALQTGAVPPTRQLEEMIDERHPTMQSSLYHMQIQRFMSYFSLDQFIFTVYEDIAIDARCFIRDLYGSLGVDSEFEPPLLSRSVNVTKGLPRSRLLYRSMRRLASCGRMFGLDESVAALGRSRLFANIENFNTRRMKKRQLTESERGRLEELFAPDVRKLADLIQRDLRALWFEY